MISPVNTENIEYLNQLLFLFHHRTMTIKEIDENPFSKYFLYLKDEVAVAYIQYSIYYEKAELDDIYVMEEYRRLGIGKKLLDALFQDCYEKHCFNITLEVRENNKNALMLYRNYGFEPVAIRKNYYQNCDAILMERKL